MEGNDMNIDAEPKQFDLPALWAVLQDLEDGNLSVGEGDSLAELLDRSPAARRAYLEYFHQAAVLRMEAAKTFENHQLSRTIRPPQLRTPWVRPWMAAAAALIILAALGILFFKNHAGAVRMHAVASVAAQWEIDGITQGGDTQVRPGSSVRVLSGTVKFQLESGSTMVMQGPCEASFPGLRRPLVRDGMLWVDTGSADETFEVSTADLVVRDIGTRFGVRSGANMRSEIHLHEGGVNVLSRESGIELVTLAPNGRGHAISADGTLSELPLADDPFPTLQTLLTGNSEYGNAILAQNPTSYVKFDGGVDGRYDNEIPGRRTVKSGPSVTVHSSGVNEDGRFKGFGPANNTSLYLSAEGRKNVETSVVAFLDGSAGVSQRQGSVTFWIKQEEGAKESQVLWLAGIIHPQNDAPTGSLAYAAITASGQLLFSPESGDKGAVLTSSQTIRRGKWHHVGITWGSNSASIHLDGKPVARRDDVPDIAEWVSFGNFVRFGKPTEDLRRQGVQNFHGWLDELAIWDRPLTSVEMAGQYKAAVGAGAD